MSGLFFAVCGEDSYLKTCVTQQKFLVRNYYSSITLFLKMKYNLSFHILEF